MLKGFKEFIARGNVIELAVAVVVGTAFQKMVEAVVENFVKPLINLFGAPGEQDWGFHLDSSNSKSYVNLSAILSALIMFLLTAAVVYFLLVMPMNKLEERRRRGQEPATETPEDIALLREIRDALVSRGQLGRTDLPGDGAMGTGTYHEPRV